MVRLLWLDTLARWLIEISTLETQEMPHIHTYICRKSLPTRSCNVEAVWTFYTSIMSIHIILLVLCHYVERPSTTFTSLDVGGILLHLWERQPFFSPGEAWESHCTRWRTRESPSKRADVRTGCSVDRATILRPTWECKTILQKSELKHILMLNINSTHSIKATWRWKHTYCSVVWLTNSNFFNPWAVLNTWARTEAMPASQGGLSLIPTESKALAGQFWLSVQSQTCEQFQNALMLWAMSINILHAAGPPNGGKPW
jgi:hypothetical protein